MTGFGGVSTIWQPPPRGGGVTAAAAAAAARPSPHCDFPRIYSGDHMSKKGPQSPDFYEESSV